MFHFVICSLFLRGFAAVEEDDGEGVMMVGSSKVSTSREARSRQSSLDDGGTICRALVDDIF